MGNSLIKFVLGLGLMSIAMITQAAALSGTIELLQQPVSKAKITLWQTNGISAPSQLSTSSSNAKGQFTFSLPASQETGAVYYVTSAGGAVNGAVSKNLALMSIIGHKLLARVVINELTTIGSVWPNAQLLNDTQLKGSAVGLTVGAAQVPNLVDVSTGNYGSVLLNGANLSKSTTMARMNTLASLIALCGNPNQTPVCIKFLELSVANNTLEALQNVARTPWKNTRALYTLFVEFYPVDASTGLRAGAVLPYLLFEPTDFALMIRFSGGGLYAPGKILFDKDGNLWTGNNWMPGSQSGVVNDLGGGVAKLSPGGKPLSPAPLGFNSQNINGIGWGTGVSQDKVWVGTFNKTVGVFDLQGNPLGPVEFGGKTGQFQGLGVSRNNDVWVADNTKDQMVLFPKGDPSKAQIVKVPGLVAPFGVAVDGQNRVWVTSSRINKVTVFSADNPNDVHQIEIALGQRGIAIDSKGNAWISQQTSFKKLPWYYVLFAPPKPKSIMEEFLQGLDYVQKHTSEKSPIGQVALITADLKLVSWQFGKKKGIYVPWGMTIDGEDNVWVANFYARGVVHMCGVDVSVCPPGTKTGDVIHIYQSGIIERITDNIVDAAGNVWSANNWDNVDALNNTDPIRRISTMGGGHGINVIYGIAKPVKSPLLGPVRSAD